MVRCLFSVKFLLLTFIGLYVSKFYVSLNVPLPPLTPSKQISSRTYFHNKSFGLRNGLIEIHFYNGLQMLIVGCVILFLLWIAYLYLITRVTRFNSNLNLCSKKTNFISFQGIWEYVLLVMLGLLITECNQDQILVLFLHSNLTLSCVLKGALRFSKTISNILFVIITISLLYIAVTPSAHLLCFCVFQVFFHSYVNKVSLWLPIFLVILSNDVHFNPGPHFQNNFFNFMTWNANSLAKDNFERVHNH